MRRLETVLFPAAGADYLSLRWVRGSGLQGRGDHLHDLRLKLIADRTHGIRFVAKRGYCLILGDPGSRRYRIEDPTERVNPRLFDASRPPPGTGTGTGSGTGTGTGTGAGSGDAEPPAIAAAAALRDLALYDCQHRTILGAAGGVRGRLRTAPDTWLPWALVTATLQQDGETYVFVAQADAKGEFALDLSGLPHPDPGPLPLTLTVRATAGLDPDTPPDPDTFGGWRISADGTAGGLQAGIDVQIAAFGNILKLGELLVAPAS
jgi:hypothetical protein